MALWGSHFWDAPPPANYTPAQQPNIPIQRALVPRPGAEFPGNAPFVKPGSGQQFAGRSPGGAMVPMQRGGPMTSMGEMSMAPPRPGGAMLPQGGGALVPRGPLGLDPGSPLPMPRGVPAGAGAMLEALGPAQARLASFLRWGGRAALPLGAYFAAEKMMSPPDPNDPHGLGPEMMAASADAMARMGKAPRLGYPAGDPRSVGYVPPEERPPQPEQPLMSSMAPEPSSAPQGSAYAVQAGDTLYDIAGAMLGPGAPHQAKLALVQTLMQQAGIQDPTRLAVGTQLAAGPGFDPAGLGQRRQQNLASWTSARQAGRGPMGPPAPAPRTPSFEPAGGNWGFAPVPPPPPPPQRNAPPGLLARRQFPRE